MPPSDFDKYAPAPFSSVDDVPNDPNWVFVDFTQAQYTIDLDLKPRVTGNMLGEATVTATIVFTQKNAGRPVIEFMSALAKEILVQIDGAVCQARPVRPEGSDRRTRFFGIDQNVVASQHELRIEFTSELWVRHPNAPFTFMFPHDPGVYWHYRMSDAEPHGRRGRPDDCNFLGRYLPTNLEFDAHPKTIDLKFNKIGGQVRPLQLFTNAEVPGSNGDQVLPPQRLDPDTWYSLRYPSTFRSSALFFYLADDDEVDIRTVSVNTGSGGQAQHFHIFGRKSDSTPNDGFTSEPRRFTTAVHTAASTLISYFGRFPFDDNLLFSGRQGMEYAAAAEISGGNVLHELFHLYFARHVTPVDGPSGWWDEALAHWFVSGRNRYAHPPDVRSQIGGGPRYRRWTSEDARTTGAMLIGYLHGRLIDAGAPGNAGMLDFLRHLLSKPAPLAMNTDDFRAELESFAGTITGPSIAELFRRYVKR